MADKTATQTAMELRQLERRFGPPPLGVQSEEEYCLWMISEITKQAQRDADAYIKRLAKIESLKPLHSVFVPFDQWPEHVAKSSHERASRRFPDKLRDASNGIISMKTDKGDFGLLEDAADEIERLRKALHKTVQALRPFAGCVYNDNGDMSVSDKSARTFDEYVQAYFAMRSAKALLGDES